MASRDSFSKWSREYRKSNLIQKLVADEVLKRVSIKGKRVIDLGSGDGEIYRQLNWEVEQFIAVDLSKEMLELHPNSKNIQKIESSFDSEELWKEIQKSSTDLLISSSSFQWSKDINQLLKRVKSLDKSFSIAVFSSGTFNELHQYFGLESPIYQKETILEASKIFSGVNIDIKNYSLEFQNGRELLNHIRNSGVSGNLNKLSTTKLRQFIREEPFTELSFEVIYISN